MITLYGFGRVHPGMTGEGRALRAGPGAPCVAAQAESLRREAGRDSGEHSLRRGKNL